MPVGTGFFDTYMKYIDANEGVEVMLNTKAEEITMGENGRVNGIVCTGETGNTVTIQANNGVVVATGGFARNVELRQAYNTQWADLGENVQSTNHAGATGDAVKMLMKLGADFVQMGNIQLLPLGDPETGSLSGNIEHNGLAQQIDGAAGAGRGLALGRTTLNGKGERLILCLLYTSANSISTGMCFR